MELVPCFRRVPNIQTIAVIDNKAYFRIKHNPLLNIHIKCFTKIVFIKNILSFKPPYDFL